jgi:hypothetical protein
MYIIENGKPVPCNDVVKWAEWFEKERFNYHHKCRLHGVRVSLVFLGLDHSFGVGGPPVLWEIMTFAKRKQLKRFDQQFMWRFTSEE